MRIRRESTGRHVIAVETQKLRAVYERRHSGEMMGRFGGGWQWKLGIQAGGNTAIVSLGVATLKITSRFEWKNELRSLRSKAKSSIRSKKERFASSKTTAVSAFDMSIAEAWTRIGQFGRTWVPPWGLERPQG